MNLEIGKNPMSDTNVHNSHETVNIKQDVEFDSGGRTNVNKKYQLSNVEIQGSNEHMPIVEVNIGDFKVHGLIDSGAGVSLCDYETFVQLKENNKIKINYIGHRITLQTLTKQNIPFVNCIQFSFKIGTKNCRNTFFVTSNKLNNSYQILLGYDFMHTHKAILDTVTNSLKFGHVEIKLDEGREKLICNQIENITMIPQNVHSHNTQHNYENKNVKINQNIPTENFEGDKHNQNLETRTANETVENIHSAENENAMSEDNHAVSEQMKNEVPIVNSNESECNDNTLGHEVNDKTRQNMRNKIMQNNIIYAILEKKLRIEPGEPVITTLKLSKGVHNDKIIAVNPLKTAKMLLPETSIQTVIKNNLINVIFKNDTEKVITLNKRMKVAQIDMDIQHYVNETMQNQEVIQISNINKLNINNNDEMLNLRKRDLNENDFKVDHLSETDKNKALKFLMKNYAVFSKTYETLGATTSIIPDITLTHNFPIQCKPYPLPRSLKHIAEKEIQELVKYDLAEKTTSPYAFPIILIKKNSIDVNKPTKYRLAVDFRAINQYVPLLPVPLPRVKDVLHDIAGYKMYTCVDLKSAYMQICLQPKDYEKLAFTTEFGNYHMKRLAYGLKNSGNYFQLLMDKVIGDLRSQHVYFYIDDLVICGNTVDEILEKMHIVFQRLKMHNLTLDPLKVQLFKSEIEFLGYTVNEKGIAPSTKNCAKIANVKIPNSVKKVKSFLGMANYFRILIHEFARIAEPLVELTKKNVKFVWNNECQHAFDTLKAAIFSKPIIRPPDDVNPFILCTDASLTGIAGILFQEVNGIRHVVEYFSKGLNTAQRKYPSIKLELMAIYESIKYFREYLFGRHFTLLSDAKSLMYHLKLHDKVPNIIARWLIEISQFSFNFKHQIGNQNPSDYLSRQIFDEDTQIKIVNQVFINTENFSIPNIVEEQLKDVKLRKIITALESGKYHKHKSKEYYIDQNNKLLMVCKTNRKYNYRNKFDNKIVIPHSLKHKAIEIAHAPHFGIEKTYQILNRKYFWIGAYLDVKNYCKSCEKCLLFKDKNIAPMKPQKVTRMEFPGSYLQIDCVGKLPRSSKGHFFMITIIDVFSRYLEVYPVTNITANTVINVLEQYFSSYGVPLIIQHDNGTNFQSEAYIKFTDSLNIKRHFSSIYYPKSQGMIEKLHHIMKESLICIANKTFNWSDAVRYFKLYYNASIHKSTNFEPAFLFFLRDLNLPYENLTCETNNTRIENLYTFDVNPKHFQDYKEYVEQNLKFCQQIYEDTLRRQNEVQDKQVLQYNKVRMNKVGDIVFVKNYTKALALQPKFHGPYRIIKLGYNNNIILKNCNYPHSKPIKIHVNKAYVAEERKDYLQMEYGENTKKIETPTNDQVSNSERSDQTIPKRSGNQDRYIPPHTYNLRPR